MASTTDPALIGVNPLRFFSWITAIMPIIIYIRTLPNEKTSPPQQNGTDIA